jgi:hypothetical protein
MAQPTRIDVPEPVCNGLGATIMGPRNVELERQNPNLLASPYTDADAGTIANLKFSFSDARNRLHARRPCPHHDALVPASLSGGDEDLPDMAGLSHAPRQRVRGSSALG